MAISWTFEQTTNAHPAALQSFPIVAHASGTSTTTASLQSDDLAMVQGITYICAVTVSTDANTTVEAGIYDVTAAAWVGTPISIPAGTSKRAWYTLNGPTQGHTCVFQASVTPVNTAVAVSAYFGGPQCETGRFASGYRPLLIDHITKTLALQGHDASVQTGAARANAAIDGSNIILPSAIDLARAYINKGALAMQDTVDLTSQVTGPLPFGNAPTGLQMYWNSAGDLIDTGAFANFVPNSVLNVISDVALQFSTTTSDISCWVTNADGTDLPIWTFPNTPGNGGTCPFPGFSQNNDGSWSNVDGVSSSSSVSLSAAAPFTVSGRMKKGSATGTAALYVGNQTNGYLLQFANGTATLGKYVGGTFTGLGSSAALPNDTAYHFFTLTLTPGSPNSIYGSIDGMFFSATDSSLSLTTTAWPITVYTGGSSGALLQYQTTSSPLNVVAPSAEACGSSSAPLITWTGLTNGASYYPVVRYNIPSASFSCVLYASPLTAMQMRYAYGDGADLAVCGSANTLASIPVSGGTGHLPGGNGTRIQVQ